jgi:5-methylcytosine-specific restriction endonuclease McrA
MNIINQPVLALNKLWQRIDIKSVKEAFIAMMGGDGDKNPPALGIAMDYNVDADGNVDWVNPTYTEPVSWERWLELPVRDYDWAIHTNNRVIRVPRQIIQPNYVKMPIVTPRPTKDAIRKRDGNRCQYTGKLLTWKESNIDHVIPRDQGGKNTFENMVVSDIKLNSIKANRTPQQAGLKLLRKPVAPKPIPRSATLTIAYHPSWVYFMDNVTEVRGG